MATRAQLMEAIDHASANGWTAINGNTLRRTWTLETPETNRYKAGAGMFGKWDGDTYDRHLFITIVGSVAGGKISVILGDARAPWVGRDDTSVSLKRAIEVLTADYNDKGDPR